MFAKMYVHGEINKVNVHIWPNEDVSLDFV